VKTNTSTYTEGYSPSKGEILALKLSKILRKEKKKHLQIESVSKWNRINFIQLGTFW